MSPRTNESAPDGDHGERSVATPEPDPAPPIRAATDSPGRSAARARVAAAGRTTSAHAPSTSEDTTVVVPAAAEGTVVDGENEKNSAEYDEDAAGDERTDDAADGGGPGTVSGEAGAGHERADAGGGQTGVSDEPAVAGDERGGAGDERVDAVRRVSASARRWRTVQLVACAASLAVALTAGAVVVGAVRSGSGATVAAAPSGVSPQLLASGDLDTSITALQAHLRAQPKDFGGWATLGLAYVEQARTKGDPSRYPQAQQALDRSLKLRPGNEPALAGRAALAAARHDFTGALTYADTVLKENPYSERALSSRIDALVELGRYTEASKAADLADARRPGVPVFTRYAYVHELRGDVRTARRVLEQALGTATSRGDISYVASALGQLAWNQGEYTDALTYYARALAADDTYLPALEGRARAQAARGDEAAAIKGMEQVVERYPLPQPLVELGELYEARGNPGDVRKAHDQYALVDAWIALAHSYGVDADLDTALAAADHGDRGAALKAARDEWARRHTVHTADALAWALHVNGRDAEALPYARRATATGYRNASFLYHRGMIERATGHGKEARASLKAALGLNAGFSPLGARAARKALEDDK
ncbi:tetratricopeptide repeat protein [Streptomyces sp. NBC_01455]|uniref:tetratricopeptide repeat protein n=1 Tax=Streptomyces sp. NBC_01455 TaxID=2903874 RepID=UPI002E3043D6|nr:tetratricopeptide repeat protein [Streptomyces sp. NBC_01455]